MRAKVVSLLVALVTTTALWAYDFKMGDLYYTITHTSEPYTVEVASNDNYSNLTIVSIPNTVTFNGITFTVTSIGERAFSGCKSLTSVTIPNSVTSIGWGVLYDCSSLTSIVVESGNTMYDSRNNCNAIIATTTNILVQGCKTTIIPNSVTSIGSSAFTGCLGLTSITIPNSVTSIGWGAFSGCTGLTSITIPNSVTSIGWGAFSGCTGLTSITIPNSVNSILEYAFRGCMGLTSVAIGNRVASIRQYAFYGCTGLTSIVVESGNTIYDSRDNCNAIIT